MKKYYLLLLSLLLNSCNFSSDNSEQPLNDNNPFVQGITGNIKSISQYHYKNVSDLNNLHILKERRNYTLRKSTYDKSGSLSSTTDSITTVYGLRKTIINYDKNPIKWFATNRIGDTTYRGIYNYNSDNNYTEYSIHSSGDTSLITEITLDDKSRTINKKEYHLGSGDSLLFEIDENYTYTPDGHLASRRYLNGFHKGDSTNFMIDKTDENGNPIMIIEKWTGNKKGKYEVIELNYEYYD